MGGRGAPPSIPKAGDVPFHDSRQIIARLGLIYPSACATLRPLLIGIILIIHHPRLDSCRWAVKALRSTDN